MAPPTGKTETANLDRLYIPQDSGLQSMLGQLDLQPVTESVGKGDETTYLTQTAVEEAGLSYDFFKAFAALKELSEGLRTEAQAETQAKGAPEGDVPAGEIPVEEAPAKEVPAEEVPEVEEAEEPKYPPEQTFDDDEIKAMTWAFNLLGLQEGEPITPETLNSKFIENPELVRAQINAFGAEPCWLAPEALYHGLFGAASGGRIHHVGVRPMADGLAQKSITMAIEFECPYVDSLSAYATGLSFSPDLMPEGVKKAAESTLQLEFEGGNREGSGFVILEPGYILTAHHAIDGLVKEGEPKTVDLKIIHGNNSFETTAQIVDIPAIERISDPDLALLYVGETLGKITPLQFSDNLEMEWVPGGMVNVGSRTTTVPLVPQEGEPSGHQQELAITFIITEFHPPYYRISNISDSQIFEIGNFIQEEPQDLLVTPGGIDVYNTEHNTQGILFSSAVALPGGSGGPAVDREGNVVGLVFALSEGQTYARADEASATGVFYFAQITGSMMQPAAIWAPQIQEAIEGHKATLTVSTPSEEPESVPELELESKSESESEPESKSEPTDKKPVENQE